MKKIILFFSLVLIMCSCATVSYQIVSVEAIGNVSKYKNDYYLFENDDCAVSYVFWSEGGNPGFVFYNKTDKPIFLFLNNTHYIRNAYARDFFLNREFSNFDLVNGEESLSVTAYGNLRTLPSYPGSVSIATKTSSQSGTTVKYIEKPVISIPPRSLKVVEDYKILGNSPGLLKTNSVSPKTFTLENTPCVFKLFISYSFESNGEHMSYIENEFWLSKIENMKYSKINAQEKENRYNDPIYAPNTKSTTPNNNLKYFYSPFKFYITIDSYIY